MIPQILLSLLVPIVLVQSQATRDCNGVTHGSSVDIGRYYYTCKDGLLDPTGCLSESNERVPLKSTFKRGDYLMLCKLGTDGYMTIEYSACVINGNPVQPGDTYESEQQWFTCSKEANGYIMQKASGCIGEGKKRLQRGEKVHKDTTLFECREDQKGLPTITEVGCVSDNQEYKYGDTFTDDKFWYFCGTEAGHAMRKVIGCVHDGKKLYDGQLFYQNDVIFRCIVNEYKSARHAPVGCVKRDEKGVEVQKSVGCYWIDGEMPNRYTVVCTVKNETCVKTKINCYYSPGNFEYILEPGCFRKFGDKTIGCKATPDGQVEYVSLDPKRIDQAISQGLHLC